MAIKDLEKDYEGPESTDSVTLSSPPLYGETEPHNSSAFQRWLDGFKRDPSARTTPKGSVGADGRVFDPDSAAAATAASPLARRLKGRHLQMIAIGGSIGITFTPIKIYHAKF